MDLLNGILNGGLGENTSRSSGNSNAPRSGGTTVINVNAPLTEEEQNARHTGGYSSSSGTVERWYIDEETGRKYYTAGDKAGTWEQVQAPKQKSTGSGNTNTTTDPYKQHILTDNQGLEYLIISDGKNSWKIYGSSRSGDKLGKPVADKLHEWLSIRYRHGLIDGSVPGFDVNTGRFRVGNSSSRTGSTTIFSDTNKTTAYNTALLNGKVITLTQVLKSVNPSTHVFYVPVGYYYQGDISEAPSVSSGDADDAGERAGYNKSLFDIEIPTPSPSPNTSEDNDNTMLFLFLPLLALVATKYLKANKKRKKR